MHNYIPYGRQIISESDIEAVVKVLRSPMLTQGPKIQAFEEGIGFDLIINTTPISMLESEISFPDSIFKKGSISYDLFYSQSKTKFQLWSEKCGASESYNGIGMLIEQAALSYEIWNNYKPKTEKIAEHLGF